MRQGAFNAGAGTVHCISNLRIVPGKCLEFSQGVAFTGMPTSDWPRPLISGGRFCFA